MELESVLCTIEDLKRLTSIGNNVDVDVLWPHVLLAQQLFIEPVLGRPLYEDIISKFDNNELSGYTETLWSSYLVPCLAYCSWYNSSIFLNYKTNRTGINTHSSDVLTPLSTEEMSLYVERVNNFKTYWLNRLEDYLIDNADEFPLYRQNSTVQNSGGSIFLGWKTTSRQNPFWDKEDNDVTSD